MNRSSLKRSHHHLKQLVESVVADQFNLQVRGLLFLIDELNVLGSRPKHLKVWATLHFLPLGSPFCCCEPMCHALLHGAHLQRVNEELRRSMGILQTVSAEFALQINTTHAGVEFDDPRSGSCRSLDPLHLDQRDALGRTALMRAAVRGHGHLVEEMPAGGADPTTIENRGRGITEQVPKGQTWIIAAIEEALAKLRRQ